MWESEWISVCVSPAACVSTLQEYRAGCATTLTESSLCWAHCPWTAWTSKASLTSCIFVWFAFVHSTYFRHPSLPAAVTLALASDRVRDRDGLRRKAKAVHTQSMVNSNAHQSLGQWFTTKDTRALGLRWNTWSVKISQMQIRFQCKKLWALWSSRPLGCYIAVSYCLLSTQLIPDVFWAEEQMGTLHFNYKGQGLRG